MSEEPQELRFKEAVFVRWVDSASPNRNGWIDLDEADISVCEIATVGFVIKETDEELAVASDVPTSERSNAVAGLVVIPKCAIKERIPLRWHLKAVKAA